MKFYWQLFWSFIKIGAFTLGGGYAMIPLIENEVVNKRQWITANEFSESLTLAQSAPGPIAVNAAVFVGYKLRGVKGALMTVPGAVIPSFAVILCIAVFFPNIRNNEIVERMFSGLRPAVVALIAVPVVNLLKKEKFARSVTTIAASAAVAVAWLKISPIIVMIAAGIGGLGYYLLSIQRKGKNKNV
jgi:chromate transporter